jgi:hypothetical protein
MRINIKDSWLTTHIGNDKRIYRKYRTFYNKILNINKLFYFHRISNIPMHSETEKIILEKVKSYLIEMDKLYVIMVTGEMPPIKLRNYHNIKFPGSCKDSIYLGGSYISTIKELYKLKAGYKERKQRKQDIENIKSGNTDNSIFNKIKNIFKL